MEGWGFGAPSSGWGGDVCSEVTVVQKGGRCALGWGELRVEGGCGGRYDRGYFAFFRSSLLFAFFILWVGGLGGGGLGVV
jgi:hypothetical protein